MVSPDFESSKTARWGPSWCFVTSDQQFLLVKKTPSKHHQKRAMSPTASQEKNVSVGESQEYVYIYVYIISLQVDQPSRGYQFCPQDSLPGKRCRMESEVFKASDETIGDVLQHGTTSIDMHTCVYNIFNIYSTSAEIHIMYMSNKTQGVYIYNYIILYIYIMDEFVCISFISFNFSICAS